MTWQVEHASSPPQAASISTSWARAESKTVSPTFAVTATRRARCRAARRGDAMRGAGTGGRRQGHARKESPSLSTKVSFTVGAENCLGVAILIAAACFSPGHVERYDKRDSPFHFGEQTGPPTPVSPTASPSRSLSTATMR